MDSLPELATGKGLLAEVAESDWESRSCFGPWFSQTAAEPMAAAATPAVAYSRGWVIMSWSINIKL